MDNNEMRDTIRQMLKDWNEATEEQRQAALQAAAMLADEIVNYIEK